MSPADLKRLVRIGEGYHLEFKRKVSSPIRIAREAIAFANTWGGTILVGVDDDGAVIGVKDAEEELFDLRRAFTKHCDPPVAFSIETVPVSRKREVVVATIEESKTKPHALVDPESSALREVLVRVEEHTRVASPELTDLMRTENDSDGVRFELGEKELMLLRYLETYDSIRTEQFARMAGIPVEVASSTLVVLARAGVLRLVSSEKGDAFVFNHENDPATTG